MARAIEKGATYLDKLCHKFYDEPKGRGKKTDYVCRLCGGPLETYYCEERLYLVKCADCGTLALVKTVNPEVSASVTLARPTLTLPNETPPCYQPDGDGCAYQCYDGDDEPIDKCKECPLCYSDKQRHHAPPNEWVSVENALPPNMDDVLVVVQNNGECWTVTGYYSNTSNVWYAMLNGQDTQMDVLWWMPFPAPPDRRPPEGEA